MNIGIVTHRLIQGDGQGYINLCVANAAIERGHAVTLFATDVASDLKAHPSVTWCRIQPGPVPSRLLKNQVFALKSRRAIRKLRPRIDVLMANGAITWTRSDVNAIHFVHGAWSSSPARREDVRSVPHSLYRTLYSRVNAAWEKWSLRRTQRVVAVSRMVHDQIQQLGLDVEIDVIENGVDTETFTPEGPAVDRQELGCPPDVPVALFVGDIRSSLKNLETVLHALREAPSMHLVVAGDTQGSPYPNLASKLGVSSRVHFVGYRSDVPELMRTANLFVFPSRYETFSLVVLEAMASGTPVITAQTVGASDLVNSDSGIVLADPNDTEELAASMQRLATSSNLRREMGRRAREIAMDYSIDVTANRYVDLFESLYDPVSGQETGTNAADPAATSSSGVLHTG